MKEKGVNDLSGNSTQKGVMYENFKEESNYQKPSLKKESSSVLDNKEKANDKVLKKIPDARSLKTKISSQLSKTNTTPPTPNQDKIPNKKIKYWYAGKESLIGIIKRTMPKEFFPTKRLELIFSYIFLAIILISLFKFPIYSLLRGDTIAAINIGYPFFNFLIFDLITPESFPLRILPLILDTIIFLIIAYLIDISINFVGLRAKSLSKDEREKKPKIFKIKKKGTLAEKATERLFNDNKNQKEINKENPKEKVNQKFYNNKIKNKNHNKINI